MELLKTVLLFIGLAISGVIALAGVSLAIASPVILIIWLLVR